MRERTHSLVISPIAWGHCRPELTFTLRLLKLHPHLVFTVTGFEPNQTRIEAEINNASLTEDQIKRLRIVYWKLDTQSTENEKKNANAVTADDGFFYNATKGLVGVLIPTIEGILDKPTDLDTGYGSSNHEIPVSILFLDIIVQWGNEQRLEELFETRGLKLKKKFYLAPLDPAYVASCCYEDSTINQAVAKYKTLVTDGVEQLKAYEQTIGDVNLLFPENYNLGKMHLYEMAQNHSYPMQYHLKSWSTTWPAFAGPKDWIVFWPPGLVDPQAFPPPSRVMLAGPQLLLDLKDNTVETNSNKDNPNARTDKAITFLNEKLKAKGSNSVIYLCFGSEVVPPSNTQAHLLVEALKRSKFDVLYVESAKARPERLKQTENSTSWKGWDAEVVLSEEIEGMGDRACVVQWCDQFEILGHPAIGGFISHCGSNSAQEAIIKGVPMIVWPGAHDQTLCARRLAHYGLALELIQVRTGLSIGRKTGEGFTVEGTEVAISREFDDVLNTLSSDFGDELRKHVKEVGEEVLRDVKDGVARQAMMSFGNL